MNLFGETEVAEPKVKKIPRKMEELLASGLAVIDLAFQSGAQVMRPMFSGGHDSLCSCHVASQHPMFSKEVSHIDTSIGAKATRQFVDEVCAEFSWNLKVYKSNFSYERFIRERGFPGPGRHQWAFNRLKDRCLRQITQETQVNTSLVTGCRQQESTRRMGHVEPLQVGETSKKTGKVSNKKRFWTSPCFDWSSEEQAIYMEEWGLPRNPLRDSPLAMSGECFCGAFAAPNELLLIQRWCPDVAEEIERLTEIAKECGKHSEWGVRPENDETIIAQSGLLCNSCDRRGYAAGLLFDNCIEEDFGD